MPRQHAAVTERRLLTCYGGATVGAFRWQTTKQGMEQAHVIGCTSVSWAPADAPGALVSAGAAAVSPMRRLCSAGCDNTVKVHHRRDTLFPACTGAARTTRGGRGSRRLDVPPETRAWARHG